MGKTIQIISLFVSDNVRPNLVVAYDISIYRPVCLADLYVSPTVAIMQWRNELATHTDGMKVLVWHGASRESDVKELQKYDVVMLSGLDQNCIKSNDNTGFNNLCCHGKVSISTNPLLEHILRPRTVASGSRKVDSNAKV